MPSGAANGLALCHSHIRGVRKTLRGDYGARGSEVPLLSWSRCGHQTTTHLPQGQGARVNQHQQLLHAVFRKLKRLGISRTLKRLESGQTLHGETPICGWTPSRGEAVFGTLTKRTERSSSSRWASPMQTHKRRVHLRGGSADHGGPSDPLPLRRANVNTTLVWNTCPSTNGAKKNTPPLRWEGFGRLGVEGSIFYLPAGCKQASWGRGIEDR